MFRHATFLIALAVLTPACGGAQKDPSAEPAISTDAADKLIPGQAAIDARRHISPVQVSAFRSPTDQLQTTTALLQNQWWFSNR